MFLESPQYPLIKNSIIVIILVTSIALAISIKVFLSRVWKVWTVILKIHKIHVLGYYDFALIIVTKGLSNAVKNKHTFLQ